MPQSGDYMVRHESVHSAPERECYLLCTRSIVIGAVVQVGLSIASNFVKKDAVNFSLGVEEVINQLLRYASCPRNIFQSRVAKSFSCKFDARGRTYIFDSFCDFRFHTPLRADPAAR